VEQGEAVLTSLGTPSGIDEARTLLYNVLVKLCKLRKARIMILPVHGACKASLRSTSIQLAISSLESNNAETCIDSLIEASASAKVRMLNTALSLIIGVLGTLIIAGTMAGLVASIAALIIGAASWLQGRRARRRLDEVNEARAIDGITDSLYNDVAGLLRELLSEARRQCKETRVCMLRLSDSFRTRCEQYAARYPYLEQG